jgi:hypothetical protein
VAILADEAAHWVTDSHSANADSLILDSVRPNLLTTGGPLLILSSPFARKGEVWNLYDKNFGTKGADDILVVHGTSLDFNPSLPKAVIDRALARNPIGAKAEYLAQFLSELEGYASLETLRACTGTHRELPPFAGFDHVMAIDVAFGSGEDSLAIACCYFDESNWRTVVTFVREWKPPFSPTQVLTEVVAHCRRWNVTELIGDRAAHNFVRDTLWQHGMHFRLSDRTTSDNFAELLQLLNSHEVLLPQHDVLLEQLQGLVAKPSSRGRTFYGHASGQHDDCAAAVACCVTHCALSTSTNNVVHWATPTFSTDPRDPAYCGNAPVYDAGWSCVYDPDSSYPSTPPRRAGFVNNTQFLTEGGMDRPQMED